MRKKHWTLILFLASCVTDQYIYWSFFDGRVIMKRKFFKSFLSLILVILLIIMMMVPAFAGKPDGTGKPPKDNEEPTDPIEITLVSGVIPSDMIIGDSLEFEMSVNATGSIEWQDTSTLGNVSISGNITSYEQTVNYTASTIGTDLVTLNVYDVSKRKAKLITSYSFEITVVGKLNDPPVLNREIYSFSTLEDTSLSLDISASGDDQLTFSGSELQYGSIDYSKLPLVYIPFDDLNGIEEFTITVTDTEGNFDSALVVINIAAVNDAPVIEGNYDFEIKENNSHTFDVVATDVDGDALVYDVWSTNNSTVVLNGTTITYTPESDTTNDILTLQVFDKEFVTNKEILVVILEDKILYVALGDSIPSGVSGTGLVGQSYVQQLEQMYNFDLINESVSGYNAVDVKDDLLSKTSTINAVTNADVITLCVGANDIMDAAPRSGFGGSLDKYDIQLEIANTGRDNFETYWQLIIEEIYNLNPDVQLITMTIYNPYNPDRSAIDAEHYDLVDTYFTDSTPDNYGLNYIINNTQSLYDFEDYNYSVADVYTAFNNHHDKDSLTGFYNQFWGFDVCDPHPNQTGHNEIFRVHGELIGAM